MIHGYEPNIVGIWLLDGFVCHFLLHFLGWRLSRTIKETFKKGTSDARQYSSLPQHVIGVGEFFNGGEVEDLREVGMGVLVEEEDVDMDDFFLKLSISLLINPSQIAGYHTLNRHG